MKKHKKQKTPVREEKSIQEEIKRDSRILLRSEETMVENSNRTDGAKAKKEKRKYAENNAVGTENDRLNSPSEADKLESKGTKLKRTKGKYVDDNNQVSPETGSQKTETKKLRIDFSDAKEKKLFDGNSPEGNGSGLDKRKSGIIDSASSPTDTVNPKLDTQKKLSEKLVELAGTSFIDAAMKNVFKMEAENDDDLDFGLDPEKAAVRKKKREKRRLKKLGKQRQTQMQLERAGSAKVLAIEYLKQWDTDRDNWKFQKVRQVYLLQNMYDPVLVSQKLKYFEMRDSLDVLAPRS